MHSLQVRRERNQRRLGIGNQDAGGHFWQLPMERRLVAGYALHLCHVPRLHKLRQAARIDYAFDGTTPFPCVQGQQLLVYCLAT